ncbi:Tat pathway signal sequence domain protein [Paenibacillus algicola]|uniref:Tat pathway signal sequence domain protein n=1 Tax=Paenibacillus algicola TaxID=2565926 RepID=A0A4P8XKD8_9BACL|nr:DUF4367 domain-containing protein [Paenibacillus algicola]QCT02845.1 Tat pathway signal sequence domain protein [Paenibacillus algicola]
MSNEKFEDGFDPAFDEAFDKAFDEAFESAASKMDSPYPVPTSKVESWQKVKQQLDQQHKVRKRVKRYQIAGIIAASIAGGAIIFSPPAVTQAISPLYQQVKDWGDGIITIVSGRDEPVSENESKAKTLPPPDYRDDEPAQLHPNEGQVTIPEVDNTTYTWDEIQEKLTFAMPELGYIPDGYRYEEALPHVVKRDDPIGMLTMVYTNDQGDRLTFDFYDLSDGKKVSIGVLGELSEITLASGVTAQIKETSTGYNQLDFVDNNVRTLITAPVTREELIAIADGMQR